MTGHPLSRRTFVAGAAQAAFGAMIVPRHVLGGPGWRAPSDTLNVAIVGAGGRGTESAQEFGQENIVAVCDVDFQYVERRVLERTKERDGTPRPKGLRWQEQFANAARYADFRVMLERQKDIDAVLIATPDHAHAVIARAAMEAGKHVYLEKPLTWSVHEARALARLARSTGVVTQMGNQGHSGPDALRINEWIGAGVIGTVRDVHVWTNRPIWPQGLARPVDPASLPPDATPPEGWGRGAIAARTARALGGAYSPPAHFDWDLYRGPIAEDVAYHPMYHPFNWRGWTAFGVGALGDMGAHLIDHPFWALDLGLPTTIEATSTPWGGPQDAPVSYPLAMTVHYTFPARGNRPAVRMHWYDGGLMPPRPDQLPDDVPLEPEGGVLYIGERGVLMHETYGRKPRIFPETLMPDMPAPAVGTEAEPRTPHELIWVQACRGEAAASSPFEYASVLTEVMLLGIVALRTGQGRTLHYDGAAMRVTNIPEANQYLTREYRAGWSV